MSNVKLFDIRHVNDEGQNDLKATLFDIPHPNEHQNGINVKLLTFNIQRQTSKCSERHSYDERQTV